MVAYGPFKLLMHNEQAVSPPQSWVTVDQGFTAGFCYFPLLTTCSIFSFQTVDLFFFSFCLSFLFWGVRWRKGVSFLFCSPVDTFCVCYSLWSATGSVCIICVCMRTCARACIHACVHVYACTKSPIHCI